MTAVLRLPVVEFAAFAAAVHGAGAAQERSPLPQGFRPGPRAGDLIRDVAVQRALAARGLLLRDGNRVVLCPQLSGLLRLFAAARTRAELRVQESGPAGGATRWCTDAAVSGRYGVRLTRARISTNGVQRDADVVEVVGFPAPRLATQLARVVPCDPLQAGGVRSLWLALHAGTGTAVDTWWDDGSGWHRVRPAGDGAVTSTPVGPEVLRRDLVDLLTGADR